MSLTTSNITKPLLNNLLLNRKAVKNWTITKDKKLKTLKLAFLILIKFNCLQMGLKQNLKYLLAQTSSSAPDKILINDFVFKAYEQQFLFI